MRGKAMPFRQGSIIRSGGFAANGICYHFVIPQLFRLAPVRSQNLWARMIDGHQYATVPGLYFRSRLLETQNVGLDQLERVQGNGTKGDDNRRVYYRNRSPQKL